MTNTQDKPTFIARRDALLAFNVPFEAAVTLALAHEERSNDALYETVLQMFCIFTKQDTEEIDQLLFRLEGNET